VNFEDEKQKIIFVVDLTEIIEIYKGKVQEWFSAIG